MKFAPQKAQKLKERKNLRILPAVDPQRETMMQILRPILSDIAPIIVELIATPRSAVMGMKYVAELKSNGLVLGKES